ncbi:lipocalin-like domain-containing protein [Vannielia litorea]|uniref:Predicted secreted hydrolase n=1 Tax=Vannielia litorea TaxID=1217970 RepID=A0A1N6EC00_9RHOB|nr:lipocalin-like domain-containing protein [Vannielia litorea]SIN80562.1 Predicted secreted hydrolase [Vannielia litorea]
MTLTRRTLLAALAATPLTARAQGFAGLGTEAEGFALPSRDTRLAFPADHGPHPAFRIEWWYLTATLEGPDGTPYGVQWTLFRSALAPEAQGREAKGWGSPQVWMAHAALTTPEAHHSTERRARGGTGQAGVTATPFSAWIDDWQVTSTAATGDALDALRLTASAPDFAYDLALTATGPLVLHGAEGYSVKSPGGQASHYYSQPFYDLTGTVTLPDRAIPVTGKAWLDREWSSQPLAENQDGWDWISLSFSSGARLMGFALRSTDGTAFTSATWIEPDGTATAYPDGALTLTPLTEATPPTRWRVELPDRGVNVEIEALNPRAFMEVSFPYWEGPVSITGSHDGRGYLEMTGYD